MASDPPLMSICTTPFPAALILAIAFPRPRPRHRSPLFLPLPSAAGSRSRVPELVSQRHPLAARVGAALEPGGGDADGMQAAVEGPHLDFVAERGERRGQGLERAPLLELGG